MDQARRELGKTSLRFEHVLDQIRAARAARDETIRRAGLDEDLSSARIYLGELPAKLIRPMGGVPEPSEPDRIRLVGQPASLVGVVPGMGDKSSVPSLILQQGRLGFRENVAAGPKPRSGSLSSPCYSWSSPRWGRRNWPNSLALDRGVLGLAGYTGGPVILAGGVGLAAGGLASASTLTGCSRSIVPTNKKRATALRSDAALRTFM